jgi:outer membrane protein OmpA-like peptidoglycan-associated protein
MACAFFVTFGFSQEAGVTYSVHASNIGWIGYVSNGETGGTTGQNRQLEAIKIRVTSGIPGSIRYNVYVQEVGWLGWSSNDEQAGTTGQNRMMEAIRIQLTGQLEKQYDVRYRVHMQEVGWSGWFMNGDIAGTIGQNRRIEALQIVLVLNKEGTAQSIAGEIKRLGIADTSVHVVDEGIIISLEDIQFQPDSAVLLPGEKEKLDKIGAILLQFADRDILVAGHTALAGTVAGRQRLSLERATAVSDYLIAQEIRGPSHVEVRGYGSDRPVADNNTAEGMKKNRRVEITLLEK